MSKELEALEKGFWKLTHKGNIEYYNIVETALKEHETHKEILKEYGLSLVNFREACLLLAMLKGEHLNIHNIANQLKAFEIIEEYDITISDFKIFNTFASFNQRRALRGLKTISKEKYDLLKGVLL